MKSIFKLPISKKLFALAILIRMLIMPFFFHPDIKTYNFQSSFMKKGVLNIYNYLIDHKQELPLKEEFVYFPLTYVFLGSYQIIASPLLGNDYISWLGDASGRAFERAGSYRYLFILKFPYLVFDVLIAFLLMQLFKKRINQKRAFIYWLFNPFTIILVYIFSNVDIIPVMLALISLIYIKKNNIVRSSIALSLAAAFKIYPIVFLPLLVIKQKTIKYILIISMTFVTLLVLIIIPFWSESFRLSAFSSGLSTRLFSSGISLGFGEIVMPSVIFISLFIYVFYKSKYEMWEGCFVLLIIILSLVHYHIQWLLWIAPFAVLLFVRKRNVRLLLLLWSTIAFAIPVLYEDLAMSFGLLLPFSRIYVFSTLPFSIVQRFFDPYMLIGILHSLLISIAIMIFFEMRIKEARE